MSKHEFGGEWTETKLDCLREYLLMYRQIFDRNEKARYLSTTYVDAFAGTGSRVGTRTTDGNEPLIFDNDDPEIEAYSKGSARIALELASPFNKYLFIEKSAERVIDLENLKTEFSNLAPSIRVVQGDANIQLVEWARRLAPRERAVVFLDPYGMQVDWTTIEAMAKTKAIDLWCLFPLGVAVNRMLPKDKPPSGPWADALTRIFGTDEWRTAFYTKRIEKTLFAPTESEQRTANIDAVGEFFINRLRGIFAGVAEEPLQMENSKGRPIYLLCFAAANVRGAPTAIRIAAYILGKKR